MLPSKRQRKAEPAHASSQGKPGLTFSGEVNQKAQKFSTNNGIFAANKEENLKLADCEQKRY
jgi:hypothetical protein